MKNTARCKVGNTFSGVLTWGYIYCFATDNNIITRAGVLVCVHVNLCFNLYMPSSAPYTTLRAQSITAPTTTMGEVRKPKSTADVPQPCDMERPSGRATSRSCKYALTECTHTVPLASRLLLWGWALLASERPVIYHNHSSGYCRTCAL